MKSLRCTEGNGFGIQKDEHFILYASRHGSGLLQIKGGRDCWVQLLPQKSLWKTETGRSMPIETMLTRADIFLLADIREHSALFRDSFRKPMHQGS